MAFVLTIIGKCREVRWFKRSFTKEQMEVTFRSVAYTVIIWDMGDPRQFASTVGNTFRFGLLIVIL